MRIVSWNVHGAQKDSLLWDVLLRLDGDVLLLQEVGSISNPLANRYNQLVKPAMTKTGKPQRFHTGVLAKGTILKEIALSCDLEWVDRELQFFRGNFVGCVAETSNGRPLHIISVHSPAW